ncbi:Hypothetical protein PHPALM_5520 [Phytophthora palmivora]|uniref:Uncharacterized protein n=1 Tax=Phytophthora palmivora TaxID=4796 RepID=A0A2P4YH59_9STRA|nr:Hypothetical protein PHPALM_5520 [Phytophthora palmivora]
MATEALETQISRVVLNAERKAELKTLNQIPEILPESVPDLDVFSIAGTPDRSIFHKKSYRQTRKARLSRKQQNPTRTVNSRSEGVSQLGELKPAVKLSSETHSRVHKETKPS